MRPDVVALAIHDFVAGTPFDDIATSHDIPRPILMKLYGMPWMQAVMGDLTVKQDE